MRGGVQPRLAGRRRPVVVRQGRPCWIRVSAGIERREWLEALEHQRREARTRRGRRVPAAHQRIILEPLPHGPCFASAPSSPPLPAAPLSTVHTGETSSRVTWRTRERHLVSLVPRRRRPTLRREISAVAPAACPRFFRVHAPELRESRGCLEECCRVTSFNPRYTFSYHRATHARRCCL